MMLNFLLNLFGSSPRSVPPRPMALFGHEIEQRPPTCRRPRMVDICELIDAYNVAHGQPRYFRHTGPERDRRAIAYFG
jgi:hypothetical protein